MSILIVANNPKYLQNNSYLIQGLARDILVTMKWKSIHYFDHLNPRDRGGLNAGHVAEWHVIFRKYVKRQGLYGNYNHAIPLTAEVKRNKKCYLIKDRPWSTSGKGYDELELIDIEKCLEFIQAKGSGSVSERDETVAAGKILEIIKVVPSRKNPGTICTTYLSTGFLVLLHYSLTYPERQVKAYGFYLEHRYITQQGIVTEESPHKFDTEREFLAQYCKNIVFIGELPRPQSIINIIA